MTGLKATRRKGEGVIEAQIDMDVLRAIKQLSKMKCKADKNEVHY